MPFTLEIDPVPAAVQGARVAALAGECGIDRGPGWRRPAISRRRSACARTWRVPSRSIRALLIVEHPTADDRAGRARAARPRRGARRREPPAARADRDDGPGFAAGAADRSLALQPATGALRPARKGMVLVAPRAARPGDFLVTITPHATRAPPLTPDFGAPVIPWSGSAWMMMAEPSCIEQRQRARRQRHRVVTS
jgi:hypothetical protein